MNIERGFFVVVRWFGLTATTVALVIALTAAITAVSKLTQKPDTNSHRPTVAYADFRHAPEWSSPRTAN